MAFRLKTHVSVAADPARDGYRPSLMVVLSAGTALDELSNYERAQLAPEHFVGVGEDDGSLPDDWRDDDARARDAEQHSAMAEFSAEQDRRREELREASG